MNNNIYKKECNEYKEFYWIQKEWKYFHILGIEFNLKVKTKKYPSGICANCNKSRSEHK